MKTTVEITKDLFVEAKNYAAARGMSFREVVEAGLRQILDAGGGSPRPLRLREHSFKGRGLAPGMDWETIRRQIYKGRGE